MTRDHITELKRAQADLVRVTYERDRAREEIRELRKLFIDEREWPALGFTASEEKVLRVLYRREVALKTQIYGALYHDRHADVELPDVKTIDVFISKLRPKLPVGAIETFVGRGYMLSDIGRKWLAERVEPKQAVAA